MGHVGFLKGFCYFISIIIIIIGIASLTSPATGVAVIIIGFISLWAFRRVFGSATK